MTPRIVFSPISDRWFVATRYAVRVGHDAATGEKTSYIVASKKHDVTDQMTAILGKHLRDWRAATRRKTRQRSAKKKGRRS